MKNIVGFFLIIGLLAAGWMNRDKLRGVIGSSSTAEEIPMTTPAPAPVAETHVNAPPPATPNPARESQAQAMNLYKGLKIPDSPLNKKFVALYADAQSNHPEILAQPDWPMKLAERAVAELGGAPLPVPTPARLASVPPPGGGALDQKPNPTSSPTPTPGDSGLTGSSLDAKPTGTGFKPVKKKK